MPKQNKKCNNSEQIGLSDKQANLQILRKKILFFQNVTKRYQQKKDTLCIQPKSETKIYRNVVFCLKSTLFLLRDL